MHRVEADDALVFAQSPVPPGSLPLLELLPVLSELPQRARVRLHAARRDGGLLVEGALVAVVIVDHVRQQSLGHKKARLLLLHFEHDNLDDEPRNAHPPRNRLRLKQREVALEAHHVQRHKSNVHLLTDSESEMRSFFKSIVHVAENLRQPDGAHNEQHEDRRENNVADDKDVQECAEVKCELDFGAPLNLIITILKLVHAVDAHMVAQVFVAVEEQYASLQEQRQLHGHARVPTEKRQFEEDHEAAKVLHEDQDRAGEADLVRVTRHGSAVCLRHVEPARVVVEMVIYLILVVEHEHQQHDRLHHGKVTDAF